MSEIVATQTEEQPRNAVMTPAEMLSVAVQNNSSIEMISKLMDLQERYDATQAKKAFDRAMALAKKEMKPVVKNKKNLQTSSTYADLSAIDAAITPIYTKHGLTISFLPRGCEKVGFQGLTARVSHEDGHREEYPAEVPIDAAGIKGNVNKTSTHAWGSTNTYGMRYLKTMIFDIATTDDDGQAATAAINDEQFQELVVLSDKSEADLPRLAKYFGVDALVKLPADKFETAKAMLNNKISKQEAAGDE